ncbi:hypothetical protein OAM67_00230 [bacterium]|nr:hypothetical protein [bacterium]
MTSQIAFPLAKKLFWWCVPFGKEHTQRVDSWSESQVWRFTAPADVVFEDTNTRSTLSIGSIYNAVTMKPSDYNLVVNCCPSEKKIEHPNMIEVDLQDTNHITLNAQQLDNVLERCRVIMKETPKARVLVHCWMGASRSCAVACYICCRLYGPTMVGPRDWDFFYQEFKKHRPSINVSCQLKNQVIALLGAHQQRQTSESKTKQD